MARRARHSWPAWGFLGVLAAAAAWYALSGADAAAIDRACIGGCAPGTSGHGLGTDSLGRDVWLQLAGGAATALLGGVAAALGSLLVGLGLGIGAAWASRRGEQLSWTVLAAAALWCGYCAYVLRYAERTVPAASVLALASVALAWGLLGVQRRARATSSMWHTGVRPDRLLLWVSEVVSSVPALLLLLALASLALRPGLGQLVLVYVAVRWAAFAVLALQETRAALGQPYVRAAYATGIGAWPLLWKHVGPNVFPPLLVKGLLAVGGFILVEGTFAFLGLGLPATQPSWGRVLAEAQQVRGGWWLWVFPGVALLGSILSLQVLARGVERRKSLEVS